MNLCFGFSLLLILLRDALPGLNMGGQMLAKTQIITGQMPPFWDQSVIFFANILSLFYGNTQETEVLKKEVGALETYGSRLLPLIDLMYRRKQNLLILEVAPDKHLTEYFKAELKLTLPEVKLIPHAVYCEFNKDVQHMSPPAQAAFEELAARSTPWLDGYVVDKTLVSLAKQLGKKTIGTRDGSRKGNDKLMLQRFLKSRGLNIFESHEAGNLEEIHAAMQSLHSHGYRDVVVKAPIGASGVGMIKFPADKKCDSGDFPEYIFFEGNVLVQGWLDEHTEGVKLIGSPSVQMFINHDGVYLYDMTDQILSIDSIHEGNVAPPQFFDDGYDCREELLRQAALTGEWLYDEGYRGPGSIDFHVIHRNAQLEVRVCEINARVTGATYPALLARTFLPGGVWMMRNIRFDPRHNTDSLLDDIDEAGLLFRPGQTEGILPFNFNPNSQGQIVKGQFLFLAPDMSTAEGLIKRMQAVDKIKGVYDRD